MMKVFFLVSMLMLSGCVSVSTELQNAIAFGVIDELNELNPEIEKQLLLRLYRSPVYVDGCFKETHGICQYDYFLSVSTFDEYPETKIFKLKTKGEITQVTWRNESKVDSAKLDVIFTEYTSNAINNNDSLDAKNESVQILVNNENISELFEAQ